MLDKLEIGPPPRVLEISIDERLGTAASPSLEHHRTTEHFLFISLPCDMTSKVWHNRVKILLFLFFFFCCSLVRFCVSIPGLISHTNFVFPFNDVNVRRNFFSKRCFDYFFFLILFYFVSTITTSPQIHIFTDPQ